MRRHIPETATTYGLLVLAGAFSFVLPSDLLIDCAAAESGPDVVRLNGVLRDFKDGHSDFGITNAAEMGHAVHNVATVLGADDRPMYSGGGNFVTTEWRDSAGNVIMPHDDVDPGLPGGHFDVDIYNKATNKGTYHKHEFDDAYNVAYIDVANDAKLLFDKLVPPNYPNDLKLTFINMANGGGGSYQFQVAGGPLMTGLNSSGFTTTFTPSKLTTLRVNFASLLLLKWTQPGVSQKDIATRDGAFAIRMYDAVSNVLKYEIVVYNHVKDSEMAVPPPPPPVAVDSCGKPISDSLGVLGFSTDGAVTSTSTFDTWFHDRLGTNLSGRYTIDLERNASGVYEYYSNAFFPADDALFGNPYTAHNYFFTYTITTHFTYHKCTGQFFEFQGNDDAWVFMNRKLVLDLGGIMSSSRQYVALDRLGLVDGERYPLHFFYANRRESPVSLFHMRTNLVLEGDQETRVSAGSD